MLWGKLDLASKQGPNRRSRDGAKRVRTEIPFRPKEEGT